MPEQKSDSDLRWEHDVQLLQSAIVQLPRNDPGRQLLQRDLDRKFAEKYSNEPLVATGGAVLRTTKGGPATVAFTRTYQGGQKGGYRVEPFAPKKEAGK